MSGSGELYASIDIGTNSALLLIAERRNGMLEPVHQMAAVPRVGRNLAGTGLISEESFAALAGALDSFLAGIREREARLVGAIATEAFRIASNGPELLARISALLGIEARIIAGPEESRLGWLAVANRHPSPDLAVLDIGGGSTEATRKGSGMSMPIGAVNTLEACGPDAAACRARARSAFADGFADWRGCSDLVVVGGTATALAMLELKLPAFDSRAIEGLRIGRDRVAATIDLLAGLPDAAKRELPGMDKPRADILMPGLCILEAFLDAIGAAEFRVSDRGVRYGVVIDWYIKNRSKRD
ncbi:MAG: Ppx/GppA phosphatase [Fibrobacteres bacterium]|nr:Ppx/GppA phosphatase [Fibrobacterota bacterium]